MSSKMIVRSRLLPKSRAAGLLLACLGFLCGPCFPAAKPVAPKEPLTTAALVRALPEGEAGHALPAHLRGVYLGEADPEGIAFVIQDETEGIYVQGPATLVTGLTRGDMLEITGVTDPGGFAPYVVASEIRKLGRGRIPEPKKVSLDELNEGQLDAKWIEITGIVRSVEPKASTDNAGPPPGTRYAPPPAASSPGADPKVKMKLASGSAHVVVELNGRLNPADFVDAEVRLRGLCFNLHNRTRQFVKPFVQVPRGVEMVVEKKPPGKPFDAPSRPVASLLQFDQLTEKHGHRVHVRGVVIHHEPGALLWIRDRDHSLRVETIQREALHPGDEVDVLGFPALGNYSAVLEDAEFRKLASQSPPLPRVITDISSALRNDADLVQLDARLTELRRLPDSIALTLDWHQTSVRAQLHLPENAPVPAGWLPGSVVRVAGVCSVKTDEAGPLGGLWEPHSFQLLLRSPADLAVIQAPPWWNAERVVWFLSGILAVTVGVVAVVVYGAHQRSQDQEHRRAMAETEFTAILSERNRLAREIHDTLSQNLGAISVQLELARTHAAEISAGARTHLATAHKLARAALTEARDSIWNMRSHVLERGDLGEALESILRRMTEGTGVAPTMRVEGDRRRLPPVIENNLLRIGQEAITNASKHAGPTRIDVTLKFERRSVCLAVEDDGIGFAVDMQPSRDRRSFGLVGIRERAELLGGTAEIRSSPGKGTRVIVTVSV
jgi:signal transduction histidine kinase